MSPKQAKLLTSLHHPLVKHLVKLRTNSKYRIEHHALLLEGLKAIQENPSLITKLLYTDAYASLIESIPAEKWLITEALLQKISGMKSPEGVIAEANMPPFVSLDKARNVLALDGINDPGNLGTLLRTALALGWDTVFFLPGTCDPFNEKALRAARGAHFKLLLSKGTVEELHQWVKQHGVEALAADLKGKAPEKATVTQHRLLVLGNEAHGISPAIRKFCQSVTIPMPGEMESLNVAVAGGILLYLLAKSPSS